MSRGRIRRNEYYATAVSLLTEAGLSWREELGGKHGKMFVDTGCTEHLITITGSPGDHRGIMNFTADVRRRIKQWKADGVASLATETPPGLVPDFGEGNDGSIAHAGGGVEFGADHVQSRYC